MKDERSINDIIKKSAEGRLSEEEREGFLEWLRTAPEEQVRTALERYGTLLQEHAGEDGSGHPGLVRGIEDRLDELEHRSGTSAGRRLRRFVRAASVAAVLVLAVGLGFYFYGGRSAGRLLSGNVPPKDAVEEVLPGGNRAVLSLSDGSTIVLDSVGNGLLATLGGTSVTKTAGGRVVLRELGGYAPPSLRAYNRLTTPRGGQYRIVLPDGTKVWLNAASSLRFPSSFSGSERRVELTGEAYFEVAKNREMPFRVVSGDQVVEVLGTHFNISAYPEEATVSTTLLEGSVRVSRTGSGDSRLLEPGEQSEVGGDGIRVERVDAGRAVAWKNGYFVFSHESIGSIMRKISRWYDIDIAYKGDVTRERFVGLVSRFENVSAVLEMLQLTGSVRFDIQSSLDKEGRAGRRIVVMP